MDRLVHQGTAAVEGLGALPASGTVIGVVAPPRHVTGRHGERAESAGGRGLMHSAHDGIKPLGEDRAQVHARLVGERDHTIDALHRNLERLLADHMHASANGREYGR